MEEKDLFVGPMLEKEGEAVLYCLDSDESSMIKEERLLTEEEWEFDKEYVMNNSVFMLSVLGMTKKDDHIILDEEFKKSKQLLEWQYSIYEKLGIEFSQNIHFSKAKNFASLAKYLVCNQNINNVSTICYSHLLDEIFPSNGMLEISKAVNKKTSLPELAKKYQFAIPKSETCFLQDVTVDKLKEFGFPSRNIYFKIDGIGGGNNIKTIKNQDDLDKFQNKHENKEILIQRCMQDNLECIHSFLIYPDKTEYTNSRMKLTTDNMWYGNIFFPSLRVKFINDKNLINAAQALTKEGYSAKNGLLAGFDSFISGNSLYLSEINARWLGSTPIEKILAKLNILDKEVALSSFDYIDEKDFEKYMAFAEKHLHGDKFSFMPVAFSAYSSEGKRIVYYIAIGDINEFFKEVKSTFDKSSFVMLDNTYKIFQTTIQRGI